MIDNDNLNYRAIVVRIDNIRPHSNADKLNCTSIFGNNIIISKDIKEGDLGVYFPLESELGFNFLSSNNLYSNALDNSDGVTKGYFGKQGRVRALKLRGEPSMGLWLPISCLSFLGNITVKEGDEFNEINGTTICTKYIPRSTNNKVRSGDKKTRGVRVKRDTRLVDGQFREHIKTPQLGRCINQLSPDDDITISWKLHGTSAIVARVLTKKRLDWKHKLARRLGINVVSTEYNYLYSSRRVIQNRFFEDRENSTQRYYKKDLYTEVGKREFENELLAGETIYYEIVGYVDGVSYIQKNYDYNCSPNENKVYVYRITHTTPEGDVIELSTNQIIERCKDLGVDHVPIAYQGKAGDLYPSLDGNNHWHNNFLEELKKQFVHDQNSQFCKNKVPEEGICLRIEGRGIDVYKLKSFRFMEHETKELDSGEVNIEDDGGENRGDN